MHCSVCVCGCVCVLVCVDVCLCMCVFVCVCVLRAVLNQEDSQENEYVMRAILRVCAVVQERMAPVAGVVLALVKDKLARVSENPRVPRFNHYLFETLACLIQ